MKNLNKILGLGLIAWVFFACEQPIPEHLHYQSEGLIVIETEALDTIPGWSIRDYYTGKGQQTDTANAEMQIPIKVDTPGEWSVWVLARPNLSKLLDGDFSLNVNTSSVDLSADSNLALEWISTRKSDAERATVLIDKTGIHTLSLKADFKSFYVDKIVLASTRDFSPVGYGPLATTSPEILPLSDKNKEEIVLPPYWAFGVLYGGYTNQQETINRVKRLLIEDYPIDAYWIDSWFWDYERKGDGPGGYMSFKQDPKAFPNPAEMWKLMGDNGIRSGIWIWNGILQKENEEIYADFEQRGFFSGTYTERGGWHNEGNNSLMGNIDFENPEAVAYYKSKLKPYFDLGVDFFKIDRSSAIPFTKAAFEMAQEYGAQTKGRGFVLAHVHSTYNPEFKKYPTKWTGDAKIDWDQPAYPNMFQYAMGAYKQNVDMVSNPHKTTYEVPFMAHDAGGYSFFGPTKVDEELYIRWTQFASFSPVMTLFSAPANPRANVPFNFSKTAQTSFKKHAQLRHRLFPYIYTYAHLTRLHEKRLIVGNPKFKNEYAFGDAFYVAPIVEKGSSSRIVNLPTGVWINFWTEEQLSGGKAITVKTPLSEMPLFVKSGAIIPMKTYTQTLDKNFSRDLEIHYYNSDEPTDFTLIEDDGLSNAYQEGALAKTLLESAWVDGVKTFIVHPVSGAFDGMPQSRNITLVIHQIDGATSVQVNSQEIKTYRYDAKNKILTIDVGDCSYAENTRVRVL